MMEPQLEGPWVTESPCGLEPPVDLEYSPGMLFDLEIHFCRI